MTNLVNVLSITHTGSVISLPLFLIVGICYD